MRLHPSDLHLGDAGLPGRSPAGVLRGALQRHPFLVGDIVDGWQLRKRWYWPQVHNDVVQKLLRRGPARAARWCSFQATTTSACTEFIGHQFGGIEVREEAVHTTADGRHYGSFTATYFDGVVVQCAKWLAYLGDNLYELPFEAQPHPQSQLRGAWDCRTGRCLPVCLGSKRALNYVMDFEVAVLAEHGASASPPVLSAVASTGRDADHRWYAVLQTMATG